MRETKRRKTEIEALKGHWARGISITAIHEAGHIVGRIMTAEVMGTEPARAVVSVQMYRTVPFISGRGRRKHRMGGITRGPMYSAAIQTVAEAVDAEKGIDL